jgi:hypothetical protein
MNGDCVLLWRDYRVHEGDNGHFRKCRMPKKLTTCVAAAGAISDRLIVNQTIAEPFEPSTSVAEVARRDGVYANLLLTWRRKQDVAKLAGVADAAPVIYHQNRRCRRIKVRADLLPTFDRDRQPRTAIPQGARCIADTGGF